MRGSARQDGSGARSRSLCKDLCTEVIFLVYSAKRVLMQCSEVPRAVDAWRTGLSAKNRTKTAASITHPGENGALFEEGWEDALRREAESRDYDT